MAEGGNPPGMRWLNAISWLAPACFLQRALRLLNHTFRGNKTRVFDSLFHENNFVVFAAICVWEREREKGLTDPLHGTELIEISTSGACDENHRHYIYVPALCQQAKTGGLFQLFKPMLY